MKNFSGIVAWYSADRIPGILSFSLRSKAVLWSPAHERRAQAAKPREKEKPPARIRGVFDCRPLHLILTPGVTTCLVSISPANHRLDSNMKLRAKVWRVWQEIKTNPHALSSFSMATKGDTPKKPANVQRAISSVNDNCRLCCCPLKIKYGEFKKIRIFQRKTFSRSRSAKDAYKVWLWQNSVHILDWKLKNQTRSLIKYVMPVVGKYGTHLISIPSSPQTWKERRITRLWWKLKTILVDSSGFCQQPFHRRIEVLRPEKGKKQRDKNHQRKNP